MSAWSRELADLYESGAASQFILHGAIHDRFVLPKNQQLGDLDDFLSHALLRNFDVILKFDLGAGVSIEKGGELVSQWPSFRDDPHFPRRPREAFEKITHFLKYLVNLKRLNQGNPQVAILVQDAQMIAPMSSGTFNHELSAIALLLRDWSDDSALGELRLASFLLTENLNDLHPQVATYPRTARIEIPLPDADAIAAGLTILSTRHSKALAHLTDTALANTAAKLTGASLASIERLVKLREHSDRPIRDADIVEMKKALVEEEARGLIEFIVPDRSLEDVSGSEAVKEWMRQDIALWEQNDLQAMPMGYLLCGPVGTGKTFLVECLAGDAGVPVVKMKNFRDRWVGSTEGNLERIFALLHALGRCIVFVDEADQALGQRSGGSNDSGVSGRVYSMMAKEMSNTRNRGRILWILASSRPDLIEVDLKRPGRIDVKFPLFPAFTPAEAFALIRALCRKYGVDLDAKMFPAVAEIIPNLITPGTAEAIAVKIYRLIKARKFSVEEALRDTLDGYQNPIPLEIMQFQIRLAIDESTDADFIPDAARKTHKQPRNPPRGAGVNF